MRITSIPQFFEAVQLLIYSASENDELQKKQNGFGFTPKRIQEGNQVLQKAHLLQNTKDQYYVEKRRVSTQLAHDMLLTLELFRDHVAIAKTALCKEADVLLELGIKKIAVRKGWVCNKH